MFKFKDVEFLLALWLLDDYLFFSPNPPHLPSCYRIIHIPLSASSSTIYSVINGTEYKSGKV